MTGLDLDRDGLVEVAALVTNGELEVVGEGIDVIIKPTPEQLDNMGDFVRDMHTNSGLLALLDQGTTLAEAEQQLLQHIQQYIPQGQRVPLAGNSVGTDRSFLARYMPELEASLHYRNVDVSSIKELAQRWYPKVAYKAPTKTGNHRALADIQESIEELRYYREAIFVTIPPSSDDLSDIAQRHCGSLTGNKQKAENHV